MTPFETRIKRIDSASRRSSEPPHLVRQPAPSYNVLISGFVTTTIISREKL